MNELAAFMRITGLQVSNEDVDSRKAAVTTLKANWGKIKSTQDIISKATTVAEALGGNGMPSAAFGEEIQGVLQKKASAFLYAERPLDVGVVAGMAMSELVSEKPDPSGWLVVDVFAVATWSALAFQPPLVDAKREELRTFVLEKCRQRALDGAEAARQRGTVPDFANLTITAGEEDKFAESFRKATFATIEALRRNAALDREELDFLWWTQLDRSHLTKKKLSSLPGPVRAIAAGFEAAMHLRRFPSDAHRDVVLRGLSDDPTFTLPQLLIELGDHRNELVKTLKINSPMPSGVFPLLNSVVHGDTNFVGAEVARPASEWGARALMEAALNKFLETGPGKL
ncbi:hypothetical protein FHS26_006882 [Rhizobium pisi]|uniref:GTPase-associated system helical domain-containing protein n=1 Tax=Rhizobium pisi TaxID=574561 RepID=A0A7W5G488_9HYPH|nr:MULTISPECIES: GTPase-associated system all-helical protein GASH [Rhizobium]MBB3139101.1 hypothetical protein [Rhizobium pisi]MBY5494467.1 hypothetical protein [Rhizobium leguminosarum]TCA37984.1 hypothetical protein E0H72_26690 [Rhizobium leguminosarum bv. viciae]TCA48160.1 hypothetical protein E0H71_30415 [Rhizobium leguminosarum bv. viciae]